MQKGKKVERVRGKMKWEHKCFIKQIIYFLHLATVGYYMSKLIAFNIFDEVYFLQI